MFQGTPDRFETLNTHKLDTVLLGIVHGRIEPGDTERPIVDTRMIRTTNSLYQLVNHFFYSITDHNRAYLIDELIIHRSIIHDIRISKAPNTRDFEIRSCNLLHSSLYIGVLVQVAKPPRVGAGKVLDFAVDLEVPADSLWCLGA